MWFHIFVHLKKDIRERRFHLNEEVQEWMRLWISQQSNYLLTTLELIVSSPSGKNILSVLEMTSE